MPQVHVHVCRHSDAGVWPACTAREQLGGRRKGGGSQAAQGRRHHLSLLQMSLPGVPDLTCRADIRNQCRIGPTRPYGAVAKFSTLLGSLATYILSACVFAFASMHSRIRSCDWSAIAQSCLVMNVRNYSVSNVCLFPNQEAVT